MNQKSWLLQSVCNFLHKVTRGSSFFSEANGATYVASFVFSKNMLEQGMSKTAVRTYFYT